MDPWYRPIAELMLLTGMISSELAALKLSSLREGYIHIKETIVRDRLRSTPKNSFRIRRVPITQAIGQRLAALSARANGDHLITTPRGRVFQASSVEGLAEDAWKIRTYFGLDFLAAEIKGESSAGTE